eukprot:TRINITY_DN8038_c0_g1_i4.p1 TRINITY_DN8038_c0_g1~~TRINITY_DN8038_c0_g1_i4.p1  ORF type:complete len:167 (-),score=19.20 TRINITY_DN8038_c0_g1_i4:540-1004(-)
MEVQVVPVNVTEVPTGKQFRLNGIDFIGASTAGVSTVIQCVTHKVLLDCGPGCPASFGCIDLALVSHCHIDHFGGLPHHCASRDLAGGKAPHYWVPATAVADLQQLFEFYRKLGHCDMPCTIHGIEDGQPEIQFKGLRIRPFTTTHRYAASPSL